MQQSKEQARAQLLHAALMVTGEEQFRKVHPPGPLDKSEVLDDYSDQQLTQAVLNYLPHVTILTAKQSPS